MKILGMRIEKFIDVADYDTPEEFENTRYFIYGRGEDDKLYEIKLFEHEGMCFSGWTTATWGCVEHKVIDKIPPFTHKTKGEFIIDGLLSELENNKGDINNILFTVNSDGGDNYYPSGYAFVNMEFFEESIRHKDKRPVWIFFGESNLGKSFLSSKLQNLSVYETDSNKELPDKIYEDVIVVGNKYPFTQMEIVDSIQGNVEIIFVFFDNNVFTKTSEIEEPEAQRFIGHVLWYNSDLGIGTLEDDETGDKFIIVHKNILTVDKSLDEGDKVFYKKGSKKHASELDSYAEDITLIL